MKFKTRIQPRIESKRYSNADIVMTTIYNFVEILVRVFLPFLLGFYFRSTGNIIFIILFILMIVFYPEFDYNKGKMVLKIKRLI